MAILLINTTTPDTLVAEIDTGTLWGVSLGTTTKRSTYSDYVLIECTKTRSDDLFESCPETAEIDLCQSSPGSFTASDLISRAWFLRGML